MELTNEQRKCMGLEMIEPAWERVEIQNSVKPKYVTGRIALYFDGDIIRKLLYIWDNGE